VNWELRATVGRQGALCAKRWRLLSQKRFYDFNVWSARKQIEKLVYPSQSGKTRTGQGT
jgi:hypothetical protein